MTPQPIMIIKGVRYVEAPAEAFDSENNALCSGCDFWPDKHDCCIGNVGEARKVFGSACIDSPVIYKRADE